MIVAASASTQTSIHSFFQPLQISNHTSLIKLDKMNYIFWHSLMENVIYANRFVDFVEGKSCLSRKDGLGIIDPELCGRDLII